MKDKKIILALFLVASIMLALLTGCDDSGVTTKTTGSTTNPSIVFKPGAVYYFTNDTISTSGTQGPTTWLTTSTIQAQTTFAGKTCYPINSVTRDTVFNQTLRTETEYFSYDTSTFIFYQYGVKQLFDSNQAGTWDPVADLSKALGTKVPLFTLTVFGINCQVSSTVESQTTIPTTSDPPTNVDCYKVNVIAEAISIPNVSASMEYYIGYTPSSNPNNPAGRVRIKAPSNLQNVPPFPGGEQKLNHFTMP